MRRRTRAVLCGLAISAGTPAAQAAQKLNVLLVMADDSRAAYTCYGEPAKTPNIDQLAARGVRFNRCYCQYPLCNPSRASMLSGYRPDSTKALDNRTNFRTALPDIITLPQLFKNNDYSVARIGKLYHYDVPKQIGTNGMDDPASWEKVLNPKGRDIDDEDKIYAIMAGTPAKIRQGGRDYGATLSWLAADGEDSEQTDGKIAAAACELLRENKDKPFFLAVGFFRPHTPFVSPKKYFDQYPPEQITLAAEEDRSSKPQPALTNKNPNYGMTADQQRTVIQAYYASITFMDAQVGMILHELKTLDLEKNTIVIYTSDHGYMLGEHGLWQKTVLYEEAARVPLIVSTPEMSTAGKVSNQLVELVDIYPTVTELAGLTPPAGIEGTSFKPLLDEPEHPWKKAAFTQVRRGPATAPSEQIMGRSLRTEQYRYVEWNGGNKGVELYNEKADARELKNLATDPQYAQMIAELKTMLKSGWQQALPAQTAK